MITSALAKKRIGKTSVRRMIRKTGFDVVRWSAHPIPVDFDDEARRLIERVHPFTATSPERVYALARAVEYIAEQRIPGDIVECGVWKGGSMMAAALTLMKVGYTEPNLYLFDTFEGMPKPTDIDRDANGIKASDIMKDLKKNDPSFAWVYSPLDEVKRAMFSTGYDPSKIHFIKGMVEDTVPGEAPEQISLLRLDTDWYESTRHELEHLFPRLSPHGVLIIDDYGDWQGARKAVDEYRERYHPCLLLQRIDKTGRIGVKC